MQRITHFILFPLLFIPWMALGNEETPLMPGKVKSYSILDHGVEIIAENAQIKILCYSAEIIRVRMARELPKPDFSYSVIQQPEGKFNIIKDSKDSLVLKTDSMNVVIFKNPFRLKFLTIHGHLLSEDYGDVSYSWLGTEVTCYRKLFPDEKFIGLGEKNGPLNRRGNSYENWNTDIPGYSEKEDPLYQSIPFFIGIHDHSTYGIFLDNSYRTRFNFGASTDDQFSSFSAANGEMNYYLFGASTVAGIIRDYTWLTGRMSLPPLWSLGYNQCRWGYYPESEFMSVAQTFRDKKIPCDGIWLDIHYMDAYKIFTWNPDYYKKPKEMIGKLHGMGFHVVTIVDPGIKIERGYFAYDEGVKNDYFIKYPSGKYYTGSVWPGRCHFPDFTKDGVRKWWGGSFRHLTDPGVDGFWNDMNEPSAWGQDIPNIVQFDFDGHGATMAKAHNIYGLEMSRATFEGTKQLLNGRRPFVLTRAGFSGIQRYSAVWTGDNTATDKDILMGVRLVNSMGLSGISFTGADIGGFISNPSGELFTRWMSVGLYSPFFRGHSEINSRNKEPWAFGEEFESIVKGFIEFRYRLLPYLYSEFHRSAETGMPVARSLAIHYTFDEKIYDWKYHNQYMFGSQLLVAPVTSDQKYCKVYFPSGDWYRISTGEKFIGPAETIVDAPLWDLPVFIKASGIIPLQDVIQNTTEKPSPVMELHVFNGKENNSWTWYEDDGDTYQYEKGEYYRRDIGFEPAGKVIRFSKKQGLYKSKFTSVNLVLHGFDPMKRIILYGQEIAVARKSGTEQTAVFPLIDDDFDIRY